MILLEVIFLVLFWAWVFAAVLFLRNTFLPRMPITSTPELFNLPSQTVHFEATDSLRLEGWAISAHPARPWIILCHGVGANRADLLDIAAGLHEAQFNLLLFDFRSHGASAGRTTSFGFEEQRDLEGALAFLGRSSQVAPQPYGVYGISMGGAVALMVAGRDERIGAVAADSPYASLDDSIGQHLALMYPWLPKVPFLWFIRATYRLRFGVWPRTVSPQESVRHLAPRSLLLIQGGRDPRMPLAETERILAVASGPKELWVVQGADHLEAFATDPREYFLRLTSFFEQSLERLEE